MTLVKNAPILNRTGQLPADGWYEIETPGEHFNRAAGLVQLLDGQAFDSIVNRFRAEAAKPNFGGVLIDQDHFSLDPAKSTEAFGWLQELRNREGRLEGRIEWTDIGQPAVEKKRFKFFSTVYAPADVEKVGTRKIRNRDYPLVRPLALDRLALTNDPNNKGGKPISNRHGNSAGAADENQDTSPMKSLLKKLGLAEDASEESAVAALQTIQNRAAQVEPLTAERDTLLAAQVEADLEKHAAVIKNRDEVKKQLMANRQGTLALLAALTPAPADKGNAPITNRSAATPPAGAAGRDAAQAAEEQRAARIQNRARELRSADRSLSVSRSYELAEAEAISVVG